MFVTKKSSINRQLKDNKRFTEKQWNVVKDEIEKRYDYEIIDWVKLVVKETIMNMGKS